MVKVIVFVSRVIFVLFLAALTLGIANASFLPVVVVTGLTAVVIMISTSAPTNFVPSFLLYCPCFFLLEVLPGQFVRD